MSTATLPGRRGAPRLAAELAGTPVLARLIVRRDRLRLALWTAVLAVLPPVTASSFVELFPTAAGRAAYAGSVAANPALLALQGPVFGVDLGAITAARTMTISATLVSVFAVLTVVRHTRAEEEAGRRELLGATVVGRHAGLAAAVAVVLAVLAAVAVAVAAGLAANGLDLAGSAAAGLALAGTGAVFAGVAAVAAQITEGARTATAGAFAVLGAAFVARASGDATSSGLVWASPIGWAAQTRPYTGERWWVPLLALGTAAALVTAAFALSARRDIGRGLLAPRPGPAAAGPGLRGPLGLAWRLQRANLLAWTIGFAMVGAAFGGIAQGVDDLLNSSPQLAGLIRQMAGGGDLVDVFLAAEFGILGLLAAAFAIAAALRAHGEETDGRAEVVLATATGRLPWIAGHVLVAVLGPAVLLLATGTTAGLVHGAAVGDVGGQVPRLVAGALAQLPGAWVLAGIAVAAIGLLPARTGLAWGALVAFLLIGQFGGLVGLPQAVLNASPFAHLPRVLGQVDLAALGWLTAVAAALLAAGLAGLRRRDISAS